MLPMLNFSAPKRPSNVLVVERLTALGERGRAMRDTEPRAGVALPFDPLSQSLGRCHLQWAAWRRQSAKFIQQSVDLRFGGGQRRISLCGVRGEVGHTVSQGQLGQHRVHSHLHRLRE
jgi:hypothetical protein